MGAGDMTVPSLEPTPICAPEAHIDGCPNCVQNVEPPRSVAFIEGGLRAAYLCTDCGCAWTTDWKD